MKKNEKIMIAVLMVVLAVMCVVLAFSKTEKKEKKADTNVSVHTKPIDIIGNIIIFV